MERAPAAPPAPRQWLLPARPATGLGIADWRWLLPGVGGAVAWLCAQRLSAGARLGVGGAATPGFAALLQAAPLAGVTLVLINRRLPRDEARRQASAARLDALAVDAAHPLAAQATALPEGFDDAPLPTLPAPDPETAALVLFTSGTSGEPKPARLSVRAIVAAARAATDRLVLGTRDTWLGCLPLDHIGGASLAFRAAVSGHAVLLQERFEAEAASRGLDACTGASLVPTMLHRVLDARSDRPWPSALRVLLVGGGPLDDALGERSRRCGLEPCQTYGLTECASQVCTPPAAAPRRGSAGPPLAGVRVRIVDATGGPVVVGAVGGIQVRGDSLFSGYERDGVVQQPIAPHDWFPTGDLGELDAAGWLTVHCRRDDLILSGGENVYPAEVEAVLRQHPAIADAAVCPLPDPVWGQTVAAAVVVGEGGGDPDGFKRWAEERLAPSQRPRHWVLVPDLPRTPTGKLQRGRLPELFKAP